MFCIGCIAKFILILIFINFFEAFGGLKALLNALKEHSLVNSGSGQYSIHPFVQKFLKGKYWDDDSRKDYETAFYKAYISQDALLVSWRRHWVKVTPHSGSIGRQWNDIFS